MKMLLIFTALLSASGISVFWASEEYKKPPVELKYFMAEAEGITVVLTWQTVTEMYASHADIERSNDNINFVMIEKKPFNAEKNGGKVYKFVDESPFDEYNYYRLKMVDKDGQYYYSKTATAFIKPLREITNSEKEKVKAKNSGSKP